MSEEGDTFERIGTNEYEITAEDIQIVKSSVTIDLDNQS